MGFNYFMPTKLIVGKDCISENSQLLKTYGNNALIVTGKSSAKINGAEKDVINALEKENIAYTIFNEITENPDVETIVKAGNIGRELNIDFIIGIGGGSPIDASKAIGILIKNINANENDFYSNPNLKSIPIIAIPTTGGTGSEATPYAILTLHSKRTKASIMPQIFPEIGFLDYKYMKSLPSHVMSNTAVDALTHLIESYTCVKSNFMSDEFVLSGLKLFAESMESLKNKKYSDEVLEKMLLASTLAGFAISQTKTSLPHALGYMLTYDKGLAHGQANACLMKGYLELIGEENNKVKNILKELGLNSIQELDLFLQEVLDLSLVLSEEEINFYTDKIMETPAKLEVVSMNVTRENIYNIYKSVNKK